MDCTFASLTVDEIDDSTLDSVVALYQEGFDAWPPVDPGVPVRDHLRWKLEQPGEVHPLILATSGTDVALTVRQTTRVFHLSGERGVVRNYPDLVIAPNFRGRGLARDLADYLRAVDSPPPTDMVLYDTVHEGLFRGARSEGAQPFGSPLRGMVLPLDGARWLASRTSSRAARAMSVPVGLGIDAFQTARRFASSSTSRPGPVKVTSVERFDERADGLWNVCLASFDLIFDHSCEFLDWRCCDPRAGDFTVLQAEDESGRLLGFAVVRAVGEAGYLTDLLVSPAREDVLVPLVEEAVGRLRDVNAHSVRLLMSPRHPYAETLRGCGFVMRGELPGPLFRGLGDRLDCDGRLTRQQATIHYTYGDTDWF